jgi:transcriptional regulator with XRE-family HTH domain
MSPSPRDFRVDFRDAEYRQAYAEDFLNTYVATQIQVLREQRGFSQEQLAELIGTKQPGVSRLENVNHSSWKTDTLRKVAGALDVWLKISFESYADLVTDATRFGREILERPKFEDDLFFKDSPLLERTFEAIRPSQNQVANVINGLEIVQNNTGLVRKPSQLEIFPTARFDVIQGRGSAAGTLSALSQNATGSLQSAGA